MGVVSWMLGNPLPLPVALGADLALLALVVAVGLVWSDGRRAVVTGSAGRRAVRHAALTSAGAGLVVAAGLLLPRPTSCWASRRSARAGRRCCPSSRSSAPWPSTRWAS